MSLISNKERDGSDEFRIDRAIFSFQKVLGNGAYGLVGAFKTADGEKVAIKKIKKIFSNMLLARRTLRELKLLRHLKPHSNIVDIKDLLLPKDARFEEIYMVQELMEADLHQIIQSKQQLSDDHYKFFLYQILKGLLHIHSANIIHRDLKPGNLLVNSNCQLRICDFGLSRGLSETADPMNDTFMSEYVATRWYRAPEVMLSHANYDKSMDIWSVGCIFAELISGRVLFPGKVLVDQINLILDKLGTPPESYISKLKSKTSQNFLRNSPKRPKIPFVDLFPKANPLAVDLLEKMLTFDVRERITVVDALQHPYLASYVRPKDLEVRSRPFTDFDFELATTIDELRRHLIQELQLYHPDAALDFLFT